MPLYQLSVRDGQVWRTIGSPFRLADAKRWQDILSYRFKNEMFKIEKIRKEKPVIIPCYLVNDFPVMVVIQ